MRGRRKREETGKPRKPAFTSPGKSHWRSTGEVLFAILIAGIVGFAYAGAALWVGAHVGIVRDFEMSRSARRPFSTDTLFTLAFWVATIGGAFVSISLHDSDTDHKDLYFLWVPWGFCAWFALFGTPLGGVWYRSILNSLGFLALGLGHWSFGLSVNWLIQRWRHSEAAGQPWLPLRSR